MMTKVWALVGLLAACSGGEEGDLLDQVDTGVPRETGTGGQPVTMPTATGGAPGTGGMVGGGGGGAPPMGTGGQPVANGGSAPVVDTSVDNASNWAACKDASDPAFKADLPQPFVSGASIDYLYTPTPPRLRCVHCYKPIAGRVPAVSEQYTGCLAFLGTLKLACVTPSTSGEPCVYRASPN